MGQLLWAGICFGTCPGATGVRTWGQGTMGLGADINASLPPAALAAGLGKFLNIDTDFTMPRNVEKNTSLVCLKERIYSVEPPDSSTWRIFSQFCVRPLLSAPKRPN